VLKSKKTIPLFDSLNADIFSEIETPPGVEKTGEHQGGILSAYHGRYLWIDYRMSSITQDQATKIYDDFFASDGWKRLWWNAGGEYLYTKGTSCIKFVYYSYSRKEEYRMIITHDYFNQSFSPKLPPLWIIRLNEFGETDFEQCPPYPYSSRPK